jgi:hypothetical protein
VTERLRVPEIDDNGGERLVWIHGRRQLRPRHSDQLMVRWLGNGRLLRIFLQAAGHSHQVAGHPSMWASSPTVAGFEPWASPSRSQVPAPTASIAVRPSWRRSSVGVRWCPLLTMTIVIHLVTRSFVHAWTACWPSTLLAQGVRTRGRGAVRAYSRTSCCTGLTLKRQDA